MTTRVLIVDDDDAIRILIRAFLETESSFDVVGEATSGPQALEVAAELMPDLVTMDFQMPGGGDGASCIQEMKSRWPEIHILALTSSGPEATRSMIEAGAYAAIDKAHMELVIPALYQIADRREAGETTDPLLASQWDQLRDVIAEMDSGAARTMGERSAMGSDVVAALEAVLVTLRDPDRSVRQANEAAIRLVEAVLTPGPGDGADLVPLSVGLIEQ